MRYRPLIFAILSYCSLLILGGCSSGKEKDPRLIEIAAIMADSPQRALARLDSINPTSLPEADRNYHGLLTVKARDKAYVTHTSDSLILSVIGYYSSHRRSGHYPEALYYGARVYSDIGDYPSSLRYFQTALDELPDDTDQPELRGRVMSQTARLLNKLRLYDQAIQYLEQSIKIHQNRNDSLNCLYDHQLLGAVYLHKRDYAKADINFLLAKKLALNIAPKEVITQDMYRGGLKYYKGELDSALTILRPLLPKLNKRIRNTALGYLTYIYYEKNEYDSALICAQELITNNQTNKKIGYEIALADNIIGKISKAEAIEYISEFRNLLKESLNQNESHDALLQNSMYNYQLHERNRQKAEEKSNRLQRWVLYFIIFIVSLICLVFYLKHRNAKNIILLHKAIENIKMLQVSLAEQKTEKNRDVDEINLNNNTGNNDSIRLREQLKNELKNLQQIGDRHTIQPLSIVNSPIYSTLMELIEQNKVLVETNNLWNELEKIVLTDSQEFKTRLQLLTVGQLKLPDYHLALLIKCGFSPTQIAALMGRTKSTITYRRETLCSKILGEKMSSSMVDHIIRLL